MKSKTRWSSEQGKRVVAEWRRSGLSMAAFARRRKVPAHRLRYWREQVEGDGASAAAGRPGSKLVPGVVVDLDAARISIRLPRGVSVGATTTADVEPTWVAELVAALEAV